MSASASVDPHERLVDRLVEACTRDDRIVAVFEGGSRARGEADQHSDVDVTVLMTDEALADVIDDKVGFVRSIGGEALFVEDFGIEHMVFVIFNDGTELEIHLYAVSHLDEIVAGPHRVLVDLENLLQGRTFSTLAPDPDTRSRQLRAVLTWFWHDLGHFTTAIARDELWWAAGQLAQLRDSCVNLVRLEQGGETNEEPYWKLDAEIATGALEPLRSTFVPVERDALVTAGRAVLAFFRSHGRAAASAVGIPYPSQLDRVIGARLDDLP